VWSEGRRRRGLQGFSIATERPHNASFSFVGDEIEKLLEFLINIQLVTLKSKASVNITDTELRRIRLSNLQARSLVEENEELFAEVVRLSLTKRDVVAIGYRKKQLDVFRLLLEDPAYFEDLKRRKDCTAEKLWQQFFEKNPWIFGYGLSYLYLDSLDDKKLEQVVQGHTVAARGKRVDALMKTRGVISSLCFVEIKTHRTPLLAASAYRAGCWAAHSDLSGAIAQVGAAPIWTGHSRLDRSQTNYLGLLRLPRSLRPSSNPYRSIAMHVEPSDSRRDQVVAVSLGKLHRPCRDGRRAGSDGVHARSWS
jgi:hypothetical protein